MTSLKYFRELKQSKLLFLGSHGASSATLSCPGFETQTGTHSRYQKQNQDAFVSEFAMKNDTFFHVFGVFDGHGHQGHLISKFIATHWDLRTPLRASKNETFKEIVQQSVHRVIAKLKVECKDVAMYNGSTFCGGLFDLTTKMLYLANIGDSVCCLFRKGGESKIVHPLHTTNNQEEIKRVTAMGGVIKDGRVKGHGFSLGITRAVGDYAKIDDGISDACEMFVIDCKGWDYLVCASDGLFDCSDKSAMSDILFDPDSNLNMKAQYLVNLAQRDWIQYSQGQRIDDITCILYHL